MVRQNLIDRKTMDTLLRPYRDMIIEYKEYMVEDILDQKGNYDQIVNIGKSLVIIKEYVLSQEFIKEYYSTLLISDINSCLYCIKNNLPKRFFYFSLRSCIESFIRLNVLDNSSNVVDQIFINFKEENKHIFIDNHFKQDIYSVMRSKYRIASGYVHGSQALSISLKDSIKGFEESNVHKDISEMIRELELVVDLIKKFYLIKDSELHVLKHIYDRRIIILKYLLSKSEVRDLL